jgi:hypothetical protein
MTSIARTIISQASLAKDGGDLAMGLERCYPAPGRSRPHVRRGNLAPTVLELGVPLAPSDDPTKLWATSPQWNHGCQLTTVLLVGLRTD